MEGTEEGVLQHRLHVVRKVLGSSNDDKLTGGNVTDEKGTRLPGYLPYIYVPYMFHVCPTYVTDEKGIRLPSIYVPYMFHVCPTYITDEKGTRLPGYRPYISYVPYMFHVCPTYVPYTRERDRENTLNWAAQFRVLVSSCW
jgi:hypothetical protein